MKNSSELMLFQKTIIDTLRKNSQSKMSSIAFDAWFSDIHLISLDSERVVVATSNEIVRNVIMKRYRDFFLDGIREALGFDCKIDFICDSIAPAAAPGIYNDRDRFASYADGGESVGGTVLQNVDGNDENKGGIAEDADFTDPDISEEAADEKNFRSSSTVKTAGSSLSSEYTFDNFVVGSSNKLAYASGKAVAEDPGGTHGYNPLFIYGPSGLGKTHLMYAIANEVHKNFPDKTIICTKSEDFLNEMVDCMAKKQMSRFRDKYRKIDMLMIDDIQFIAGKVSTQLEFFHTFDALYEAKKQIVVTSDRPPREMYTLEERIQTRFTQGMIVDVQPPEYELRLAILKKKAEKINLNIPTDVLAFLAEKLNSNIREIEGALKKIGANAFLNGKPITLEWVKSSIPEYFRETKPVTETVDLIIEVTARKYDVTVEDILGKSRTKDIKTARNAAMYICKTVLGMSLPAIGRMLNRDYSTVHSNIATVESEMRTDDKLNNEIMEIIAEVKS